MAISPLMETSMGAKDRGRAKMVAGLANHRRIEIVRLLRQQPSLCVEEVARHCRVDQSTAVEHVRRLHEAGLVKKKSKGRRVLLSTTKRATTLLRTVDLLWEAAVN
jgi:DNA-binding MarR family transcriptional regulator